MDIYWANAALLSLPSSQRVEVLVHDGATDLQLWPGPGPDRVLLDTYGSGLRAALDAQREKHGGQIEIGDAVRLHPGKLHCNYLLWVASRGPEVDAQQADAPSLKLLEQAVERVLEIAGSNGSVSVGFGALGDGPKAAPPEERLAAIVRAAHRYHEHSLATGRPARVELVRVCDPRAGVTASARRLVGRLAQSAPEPTPVRVESGPAPRKLASSKPRTAATGARKRTAETLSVSDVAERRVTSRPYDRAHRYSLGEWFVHAKFGVGQVKNVTPDGAIDVLFEDGSTKKMLHAQSS
ncbi:MAG TPA: macro domain-containing protein [Polyangiales bacterium]|nr:macro domain-containing protein [Polyangiales bacterium]